MSQSITSSRATESEIVRKWLLESRGANKPLILGVSGYGGVGKSYLLNSVLSDIQLHKNGWLEIRVDGSDANSLGNFIQLLDNKFCPKKIYAGRSTEDFFPQIRKLARQHRALSEALDEELKQSNLGKQAKEIFRQLFEGGSLFNKMIPKTKEYLDFETIQNHGFEQDLSNTIDWAESAIAMVNPSWLPGPIQDVLGITFKKRIRHDLFNLAAELYLSDLEAMLAKPRSIDRFKLTKSSLKHTYNKLLLVIDDYEILGKTISEFVVSSLIPALERASFPVKIVILGRDDLFNAHVGFQQFLQNLISSRIRLERFTDDVALKMFNEAGYGPDECKDMLDKSKGYPFLVSLFCEAKGGTVSFYQQFWDRTTRWLTPNEKSWIIPIAYLDRVDRSTLGHMIPNVDPEIVMTWFQHEASLRDPMAPHFVMAPFIREMFKEYHKIVVGKRDVQAVQRRAEESVQGGFASTSD